MAHIDDYNAILEKLKAFPKVKVKELNMPATTAAQEAENLFYWATKDKSELQNAGLDVAKIDELPVRAGALHYAQALWMADMDRKESAENEWKEEVPSALELHGELLHNFRFAYRNDKEIMRKVQLISEGSGHQDLIQDLDDLTVVGTKNPEPLQLINFDLSTLDRAANMSKRLGGLLSEVNGARNSNSESKLMRDRAFSYLKELVDEIREYGKFVFWKDEERLEQYASAYHRKTNKKKKEELVEAK